MKTVDRHEYERDVRSDLAFEEQVIAHFFSLAGKTENPVALVTGLASGAHGLACLAAAVEDRTRALRGLRLLGEAEAVLFDLAAHPGAPIRVVVEERSYELLVPQAHAMAGPNEWLDGFYAANSSRHAPALGVLTAVRREVLELSQRSARMRGFLFEWVPALHALARRDASAGRLLAAVHEQASKLFGDDPLRDRLSAEILLAIRLHEAEARSFNDALERALLAHRAFWTQPATPDDFTEDRREDPDGFLALAPLGLACLAHDRGIPIDVESDYIPRWIVRGEW